MQLFQPCSQQYNTSADDPCSAVGSSLVGWQQMLLECGSAVNKSDSSGL